MSIKEMNGGIEIDHGDVDLSTNVNSDGTIVVAVGGDYTGVRGYAGGYLEINLTQEEARGLLSWLASAVDRL